VLNIKTTVFASSYG